MRRAFIAFKLAFAFLTINPIPIRDSDVNPKSLADSRFAYPVVGLVLGLVISGISILLNRFGVSDALASFLLVSLLAILTGGLHLDGLADTADGLFLWGDRERRLAVMRDPHVGSFGVIALILVLLGKYAALEELGGSNHTLALFVTLGVSRTLILASSGVASYARPDGTGRIVIEATTTRDAIGAGCVVLVIGASLLGPAGLVASCASLVVALSLTVMARNRLGGVTGDILGAVVELSELACLVVLAIRLH